MARESTQKKLERVRPPRVQISYDVEIGNAIEMKEIAVRDGRSGGLHRSAERGACRA